MVEYVNHSDLIDDRFIVQPENISNSLQIVVQIPVQYDGLFVSMGAMQKIYCILRYLPV